MIPTVNLARLIFRHDDPDRWARYTRCCALCRCTGGAHVLSDHAYHGFFAKTVWYKLLAL